MRKKKDKRPRVIKATVFVILIILAFTSLQVIIVRFVNPPFSCMMLWERISKKIPLSTNLRTRWKPLKEISPHLRKAVLAGEDQRFLVHRGFDFIELNQAIQDLFKRKGKRGASTITMQVARTIFLWPGRTWIRKCLEAYYTILIELFWTKRRIFEVYLNTVDWGPNTRGAEAAANRYFHKSCKYITRYEAALLAAILPSPHKWSPLKPNTQVLARQKRILKAMEKMPLISCSFRFFEINHRIKGCSFG